MSDKPETAPAPAQAATTEVEKPVTEAAKPAATETKPEVKQEEKPTAESTTQVKPVVPEKYDFKKPENLLLSESAIEDISSYAKENGLSNEQAQALLEQKNNAIAGYVEEQKTQLQDMSKQWADELSKDKEIGGEAFPKNVELAKRVVDKFFPEDVRKYLDDTGLGNHPGLVRGFVRLAKQMSEDQLILPKNETAQKKSIEEVFYPSSTEVK